MMIKKLFFIMLLCMSLFLIGCNEEIIVQEIPEVEQVIEEIVQEVEAEPVIEEIVEVEVETGCTTKTECAWNEHCIEGECAQLTTIYDTESVCDSKCNFNQVQITTSDGDEFELARGKGDYTLAGAIEWQLMSGADYCLGDDSTTVAIKLKKKNYGEIIEEQVILVNQGEISQIISHPIMTTAAFTLTVNSINEECS